jgi:CheY-like chemotaxis protein
MTKVLVADSAELFLALQHSFLKRTSCEITTAGSAEEAMEKATVEDPDLIVLDADLPDFDGLNCCRLLKEQPELRHTPVVVIGSAVDLEACEKSGAEALLSRPLAEELFLEAIRNLMPLACRRSRRAAASLEVEYRWNEVSGRAVTKDISVDGLFLKSREPFSEGELLSMALDLPTSGSETLALGGEVVRIVPPDPDSHLIPGAGIRFRRTEPAQIEEIARFVHLEPREAP